MARPAATPTKLLDDERVRVTRWTFEAGAETGWHRHQLDYVIVPMTECQLLLEEGGAERRVEVDAGEVYCREAGVAHNVVNGGDAPMSFIEIEIKP